MKTGIHFHATDETLPALDFARMVEDEGIESIWLLDHTHVPVAARVPVEEKASYGGDESLREKNFAKSHAPGGMPREYYRNYDQLIAIAMMGAVTTTMNFGTGICLVVQRDPITTAKEVATIDRLTGGRFIFGVGAGAPWNAGELENHGVDVKTRNALMLERIDAMKQIWQNEQAEYHGKHVDFDPIFQWPKPITQPHPPILMGGMGPTVLDRTLSHADGWMPGHTDDTFDGLGDRITELRDRAAALGKAVDVTLNLGRLDCIDRYSELGVDRVVYELPGRLNDDEVRSFVKELGRVAQEVADTSPSSA